MTTIDYTREEFVEAKRQIDSTIHKLEATVRTLEQKEHPERYKSQLTLAKRRIKAFTIAVQLIEEQLKTLEIQESQKENTYDGK